MLRNILVLLWLIITQTLSAQSVGGSWYGRADVQIDGNFNNYLTELIIKQKGNEVEGIFGYYFKDSYQSFFIRGTYNKNTREVRIKNLPMIHFQASGRNGIECPMHFSGTLMVSKIKSSLNGYFFTEERYKYTCPELRVTMQMDESENQDSLLRNAVAGKKFWQPQEEDLVITNPATNKKDTIVADVATNNITTPAKINEDLQKALVEKFSKRRNIYSQDLEIEGDSVRVSFYDNGDIDGDSISVFLNNQPVLSRQELSDRSLNIYLALDSTRSYNEVSMLAENLGKLPPNTALMVVTDGINRYELYLSSSLTQNASVRLKRKKTDPRLIK